MTALAPILAVRQLTRTFGATVAVDALSFTVGPGEIVGLLGPNGAGKTTTIDMILGVLAATSGAVEIEGLDVARQRMAALSSGEQTRVSLAKAFLNEPRLLLLDEPTASLDPASARDVRARLRARVAGGTTGVLWTSHNMREVEEVCHRVLFLSRGKLLLEGDPRTLPAAHHAGSLEELFVRVARTPLDLDQEAAP